MAADEIGADVSEQAPLGQLSSDLLAALRRIKTTRLFAQDAGLFQDGSTVAGVYLVETGEVRLLLTTAPGQKQLLQVAGPGTLLGLSESMTGGEHRVTAEACEPTTVSFIRREDFLGFLREHCNFSMEISRLLSEDLHGIYHKFRNISAHPGRPRQRLLHEELN
jgi:CRP/FNR family transcriptional regulator, cyclic AMP receptor protein